MTGIFTKLYTTMTAALLVCVLSCHAHGGCRDTCPDYPKFCNLRYLEDWSCFPCSDFCCACDKTDCVKHIPLRNDGCTWVSFGGQLRYRGEGWNNFGFAPANDAGFVLSRARLHGDLHLGNCVRVFVEGKSSLCTERQLPGGKRTLEVDTLALQNAFIDLSLPTSSCCLDATLRLGRQELSFGKQRLVSPLDWANTRRTFDGVALIGRWCDWKATGFYSLTVPVQKYRFNSSSTDKLYGVYATTKLCRIDALDLYFLGRDRARAVYDSVTASETRFTSGIRACGKLCDGAWDYDVEAAYQWGDVGPQSISAYMLASEVGYTPCDWCWKPRFYLGFDYASGDEDPADTSLGTFSHLFPLGHKYLGWIDIVGRQNIVAFSPGVTFKPCDKLTTLLDVHFFWRAEDTDALYNAGAGIVRAGALSTASYIGWETDLLAKYKLSRHWLLIAGYSHFFTGDFIDTANPAANEDIDFGYVGMQYTF